MSGLIQMDVRCFREAVPTTMAMGNFAMIDLRVAQEREGDVRGKGFGELVLVLDRSGSMDIRTGGNARSNIELVIDAAREVANKLRPQDRLAVIGFDHTVTHVCSLTPGEDRAAILRALDNFEQICQGGGGGTAMAGGLKAAADEIEQRAQNRQGARIVVLTDGEVGDPDETLQIVARLERQSIGSMGFGEFRYEFMKKVCGQGLCESVGKQDPSLVVDQFLAELKIAQNTAASNLRLQVNATNFVQMNKCYIAHPNPTFVGNVEMGPEREYLVDLPVLELDEGVKVIFDLQHQPRDHGRFSAAEVTLLYDVPAENQFDQEVVGNIVVEYADDPRRINRVDNEIKETYDRCFVEETRVAMEEAAKNGDLDAVVEHGETIKRCSDDSDVVHAVNETIKRASAGKVDPKDMAEHMKDMELATRKRT